MSLLFFDNRFEHPAGGYRKLFETCEEMSETIPATVTGLFTSFPTEIDYMKITRWHSHTNCIFLGIYFLVYNSLHLKLSLMHPCSFCRSDSFVFEGKPAPFGTRTFWGWRWTLLSPLRRSGPHAQIRLQEWPGHLHPEVRLALIRSSALLLSSECCASLSETWCVVFESSDRY